MNNYLKEIINEYNSSKPRIYYTLIELREITGLSYRMLKYRMKTVKEKYDGISFLLRREKKSWMIHYTIIQDFLPKRESKKRANTTFKWKSIVSWNMKDKYDCKYHKELVLQIKDLLPNRKIYYVLEVDGRGAFHIHFISDAEKKELDVVVNSVLSRYLNKKDYRLDINELNNMYSAEQYIKKGPVTVGILN